MKNILSLGLIATTLLVSSTSAIESSQSTNISNLIELNQRDDAETGETKKKAAEEEKPKTEKVAETGEEKAVEKKDGAEKAKVDDKKTDKKEAKKTGEAFHPEPLRHADDVEFKICDGTNHPCHEVDAWLKNHGNDRSTNTKPKEITD